jgi:hypothetical protein
MDKEEYNLLKSKFLKIYINIPEKIRGEDIIAVVDKKPYTWNTATIEIRTGTPTGAKILKMLEEVGIL